MDDLVPPELPEAIVQALQPSDPPNVLTEPNDQIDERMEMSPSTRRFLEGEYAHAAGWNDLLFRAACDLAGRHVPQDRAMALLIQAAKPREPADLELATRTIQSAYSSPRQPARR